MSDQEVATRTPESDAAQQSTLPTAGPAQDGLGLGEHCVTDRPAPAESAPSGEVTKLADVDVYISKPSDYPHQPSKLLLFLTGGTGLRSKNNQLAADKFASEGFVVIMPDMFDNDPAPSSTTTTTTAEEKNATVIEQIKMGAVTAVKAFQIDMWLARHTGEKVVPILMKVIDTAKSEFADAVASGGGIYGVGYCFGAKYIIQLAGERPDLTHWRQSNVDEEAGLVKNGPYIKAAAIAHGTMVTTDDFDGLKSPIVLVCVENDQLFPEEVLEGGTKYLAENGIDYEVKIYPDVPHGFAVVGEYADPRIKFAQEQAFDQMLDFLKKH